MVAAGLYAKASDGSLVPIAGADGLDAYQIAVLRHGFSGTEAQWLASLVGPAGQSGQSSRVSSASVTTAALTTGNSAQTTITLAHSFTLLTVTVSQKCRVRLYATAATQAADVGRAIGTDPSDPSDLILDYATSGAGTFHLSPLVEGASLESVPSTAIPMTITNTDVAGTVTASFTYIPMEA